MAKFYQRECFKSLQQEWRTRLEEAGFRDHEDLRGNLKQYDRRTIAFDNMERVRDFFIRLDHYLTANPIPEKERQILVLYSNGMYVKDIATHTGWCRTTVKSVIGRYKKIIVGR